MVDYHQNYKNSNNLGSFTHSLKEVIKEKMKTGTAGKELHDMIRNEVDIQNRGRDPNQQLSSKVDTKSRLTPEKMKLVAPAILSKILQSEELNRYLLI